MKSFKIITTGTSKSAKGIEIAIRAFAEFYHNLTPKHQGFVRFGFVDRGKFSAQAAKIASENGIKPLLEIVPFNDENKVNKIYKESNLILLPFTKNIGQLIAEAQVNGLPVLGFDIEEHEKYIDHTCGMLIPYQSMGHSIPAFAKMIGMLYFDPEAYKVLRKGTLRRYININNWNNSFRVRAVAK